MLSLGFNSVAYDIMALTYPTAKPTVLWTRVYCLLTTGGAMIDTIRQYIEKQKKRPNQGVSACASPPKSRL